MSTPDIEIEKANARLRVAEEKAAELRQIRDNLIWDSYVAGVLPSQIGRWAGLTKARTNQIISRIKANRLARGLIQPAVDSVDVVH